MNKRLATIAAVILLVLIPAFSTAWAASWAKLVFDPGLSSQTKEAYQKAIDTVDQLFTKNKIVLRDPVTVVVAADDDESYIQALMSYANISRAQGEERIKRGNLGVSIEKIGKPPLIIVRYRPNVTRWFPKEWGDDTRRNAVAFVILPHELFHQVQHQNYSHARPVNWLEEGPAELFKFMALEAAGISRVTDKIPLTEQRIRKAAKIPDTTQLASYDYKDWISLAQQKYPIDDMADVMTCRLVGNNGFGKVLVYYQLLNNGSDPDTAFITAFGRPMSDFLIDMNDYFNKLRRQKE